MFFLLYFGIEFLTTAAILLPSFLVLHFFRFKRSAYTAVYFLFALYLGCVYFITGLPTILFCRFEPRLYLIPFLGIADDFFNSLLNMILFIPLGVLIPFAGEKHRNLKSALCIGFFCSFFIELSQLFSNRLTDINDLITNTIGAALGYLLSQPIARKTAKPLHLRKNDLYITTAITLGTMFFLQPLLVSQIWRILF